MRLLLVLAGLTIGYVVPSLAQDRNTVNPQVRQEIEEALVKFQEAFNKHDASAMATLFTPDAVQVLDWGEGWNVLRSGSHREILRNRFRIEPSQIR
jgi:hypothetical protein